MMAEDGIIRVTRRHESGATNTFRITERPPVFVSGSGAELVTAEGQRFLDFVAGSSASALGYGHLAHRAALERAMAGGIFHTGTRLPSTFRAELYEKLANRLPKGLDCFQLANSGAEAIEAAIKAAQFVTKRHGLVAFEGGYHGRTLGALSVTYGAHIRDPFSVMTDTVRFVPFPEAGQPADMEALDRAMKDVKAAAVILEAVQGVNGVRIPPPGFLEEVRRLCTAHGALMVVDEIWNGFGRCGMWFGFETSGITPDLVVMGKALSSSLPLSCVAGPVSILKAWPPGMHTSTFQGNPIACAMACAVIDTIREDDLLGHVHNVIEPAFRAFAANLDGAPGIAAVRVCGAQAAVAFTTPWGAPDAMRSVRLQQEGLANGLLLYSGGSDGNCLMLVPPLVMTASQLEEGLERIIKLIAENGPSV